MLNKANDKLMFELSAALTDTNFVFVLMKKEEKEKILKECCGDFYLQGGVD